MKITFLPDSLVEAKIMFESIKEYLSILTQDQDPSKDPVADPPTVPAEIEQENSGFTSLENTFKERLAQAKDWTSQLYNSIKSSENPTHILSSQVQNHLNNVSIKSVINKVPLLREFEQSQAEFEAEQRQKRLELSDPGGPSDGSCLPWHPDTSGLTDPAAVEDLRSKILSLSQHANTFLLTPPAEAQLGTTSTLSAEQWHLAKLLLQEDKNLAEMRYNLVPSKISEDLFWRNYFYRIALLRQSAHLAVVTGAATATDQSELGSDTGKFVYIEENCDGTSGEAARENTASAPSVPSNSEDKTSRKKGRSKKPASNHAQPTGTVSQSPASDAKTPVQESPQKVDEKDQLPSVDDLLNAELAREVDELVLVSPDDPLSDELDRELEMELAELEKRK